MGKKKLTIRDVRIGDIVVDRETGFEFFVKGIFDDGTLYLDFEGNEGDIWESTIEDIVEIKKEHHERS